MFVIISASSVKIAHASGTKQINNEVLTVEMSSAICKLRLPTASKQQHCDNGNPITVKAYDIGFNRYCSSNNAFRLSPIQQQLVARYVPNRKTQKNIWQSYGRCSPLTANQYFRQLTRRAHNIKLPKEFNSNKNYRINKTYLVQKLLSANKGMSANSIDFKCKKNLQNQSVLTQIHFCYKDGKYSDCLKKKDNCPNSFLIYGY